MKDLKQVVAQLLVNAKPNQMAHAFYKALTK